MRLSKTVIAVSLCSTFALANTDSEFLAIIGIEGSVAERVGFVYKNITPWVNVGGEYDCTLWTPDLDYVDYGEIVLQEQDCSQDQTRNKDYYTVYNSGAEVYERTDKEDQTIIVTNEKNGVGTRNYISHERAEAWEAWSNTGSHYNCESWSPARNTVDYGQNFEQTRGCSQNQIRYRDITDVWANGAETLNRVESDSQIITEEESQHVLGTRNYKTGAKSYDGWSSWTDTGGVHSCTSYSPSTSSYNYGTSFTQTRTCQQPQERTRAAYEVWADGSRTYLEIETDNRNDSRTQSRTSTGTADYIVREIEGSWNSWINTGSQFNCGSWTPSPSTINIGLSFEQTQDCKQSQERSRTIYDDWRLSADTVNRTENETRTVDAENKRNSTGTRNVVETLETTYNSWSNSSGYYSCSGWSPSQSSYYTDQRFTQTRYCSINQTRTATEYNVWTDGSKTVNRTYSVSRVLSSQPVTRSVYGTKARTGNWVKISQDYGSNKYGCTGSGLGGTCTSLGSTQTRWISAGQSSGVPVCQKATYRCQ